MNRIKTLDCKQGFAFDWDALDLDEADLGDLLSDLFKVKPAPGITRQAPPERRGRVKACVTGFLYYAFLIAAILAVSLFFSAEGSGLPRDIAGFSAMTVLTKSMQSEIPQGSLVVTRKVEPGTLRVGDDITFMVGENTTVTHRIVSITENYDGTGERGFETKGIENKGPDRDVVIPRNIIGKVVFHDVHIGRAMGFVKNYTIYVIVSGGLLIALAAVLRMRGRAEAPVGNRKSKATKKRKEETQ